MAEIDLQPTEEMASNARRGLELRKKHGKGGTAIGVARARDISNRKHLSPETVRRMHAFFNRHEKNKSGGEDDAGYIAWLLWGGDSGKSWAARKFEQLKDKQENARMERSDQLAAKLMKPVTISNHKAMEKIVDEAIAHAKRVGDDDLLELAEETGHEILALRSRASRPGAKAKMAISAAEARKIIATIEQRKAAATEWSPALDHLTKQRTFAQRLIVAHEQGDSANISRYSQLLEKAGWSRPGAKATMALDMSVLSGAKSLEIFIKDLMGAINVGNAREAIAVCEDISKKANDVKQRIRDTSKFSRPVKKATFDKSAARALWVEMFNFWDRNRADDIVRLIPKIKTMIQKARSMPDYRMLKDGKTFGPSLHQLADEHEDAINERFSRPGAKAKMDNSQKIIDRYNELKSQPKAKVFDLWKSKIQRGRVSIGEQKISEWDKGSLISDIVRAEFGDRAVDAAFKSSRPGAKAAMGLEGACWEGYEAVGTKKQDGKTVPNCVPMAKPEESEEVRSGLKMIAAKDQAVADKIRTLIGEGKDQKQAVAIALDLKRRGEI
jgi:hypothetical protein